MAGDAAFSTRVPHSVCFVVKTERFSPPVNRMMAKGGGATDLPGGTCFFPASGLWNVRASSLPPAALKEAHLSIRESQPLTKEYFE